MSDVFVSYKREDLARVERMCRALADMGLSVWWDQDIRGGEAWRELIEQELNEARCVIAVWSRNSVGKEGAFVRDEAGRGLQRGVLLPVRLDRVSPPIGFGEYQTLDLTGWRGNPKDTRILDVAAAAEAIVHRKDRPKLLWPLRRRRRMLLSTGGSALLAAVFLLALVPALRATVCAVPGIEPLCNKLVYAPPLKTCFRWKTTVDKFPFTVRRSEAPSAGRAEAETAARAHAREEEATACPAPQNDIRKLISAEIKPEKWQCTEDADGYRCGFDGQVTCQYQDRVIAFGKECREDR